MITARLFRDDLMVEFNWCDDDGPVEVVYFENGSSYSPQDQSRYRARILWRRLKTLGYMRERKL